LFEIDFYTADKAPSSDESVFELGRPFYSNNILAFAGINASGKTTALNLIELACRIVSGRPVNQGTLPTAFPEVFDGETNFRCIVYESRSFHLFESHLIVADGGYPGRDGARRLMFEEEAASMAPISRIKKADLADWDLMRGRCKEYMRRSKSPESMAAFLNDETSISAAALASVTGHPVRLVVTRGADAPRFREGVSGLDDMLRVFDARIEHLEVRDAGRAFELTFAGREPMVLSEAGLAEVLSSGTMRGLALIQQSLFALVDGGYLLIDEIENHLNRQLVNVIMDLFTSRETNPHGRTIVFTTHYPQLLDHVHRKDNVYFLARGKNGYTQPVKYSDRVKRIENKKSEVFVSNYIKGTAPRYTDVRVLKELVGRAVSRGENHGA
jgi:ABC-type lipoprotein export system ATPase subunit